MNRSKLHIALLVMLAVGMAITIIPAFIVYCFQLSLVAVEQGTIKSVEKARKS